MAKRTFLEQYTETQQREILDALAALIIKEATRLGAKFYQHVDDEQASVAKDLWRAHLGEISFPTFKWETPVWAAEASVSVQFEQNPHGSCGVPYFVNGLGGANRFGFSHVDPHSQFRFEDPAHPEVGAPDWGAQFVTATRDAMTLDFVDSDGAKVDSFTVMPRSPCPSQTP